LSVAFVAFKVAKKFQYKKSAMIESNIEERFLENFIRV
jgi:hypothetical protein